MPATVLFADISGFTPLADKLSKLQNGVAVLTNIINTLFDPFIDLVGAFGGDVIKFAGDALVVAFPVYSAPGTEHDVAAAKRRLAYSVAAATECGLVLNDFIERRDWLQDGGDEGGAHTGVGVGTSTKTTRGASTRTWRDRLSALRFGKRGRNASSRRGPKGPASHYANSLAATLARHRGMTLYEIYIEYVCVCGVVFGGWVLTGRFW